MAKKSLYKKKNSKGLSAIVTTLILVALTLGAVALIWAVINNMIKGQMDNTKSCFGSYNKAEINPAYTCYEDKSTADTPKYNLRFSLQVKDIGSDELDKIIVGISSAAESKTYGLTYTGQGFPDLKPYGGLLGADVTLPQENGAKTYVSEGFTEKPDSIKIALVINENQCDVSDTLTEIEDCAAFAGFSN